MKRLPCRNKTPFTGLAGTATFMGSEAMGLTVI